MAYLDILIPTYKRPTALAVTLTSLLNQTFTDFRVVVSDQTEDQNMAEIGEIRAVSMVIKAHGQTVEIIKHLPRRGLAEQRQFLLDQANAPYVLFIDDDLILEPWTVAQMLQAIQEESCGFVGSAVLGLSYLHDVRPYQQAIEFWNEPVKPEEIQPDSPQWDRYKLHNAANLYHVAQNFGLTHETTRKYKIAWVGGCTLYKVEALRSVGGFNFWKDLPEEHCGEDVLAQQRVMARYGGCAVIPSGVYHQELPTTVENREVNAPRVLSLTA